MREGLDYYTGSKKSVFNLSRCKIVHISQVKDIVTLVKM